jgi:hypothetical protein
MDSQSISFVHHGVAGQSGGIDFQRSRSRDCPMPAARSVPRPITTRGSAPTLCFSCGTYTQGVEPVFEKPKVVKTCLGGWRMTPWGRGKRRNTKLPARLGFKTNKYSSTWRQIMACIVAFLTSDTVGNLGTRSKGLIEY